MKKFTLVIKEVKVGTGHVPHRSGQGKHADRRLKRQGTRKARTNAAMKD